MYAISRGRAALTARYWQVSFRRRGEPHERRFYDIKHGGSREALAAAIAWRDKTLAKVAPLTWRQFCQQKRSNNTSGVPGVHFLTTARQPLGYWQARIKTADRKASYRTFSVRKFGNREAFRRAVTARNKMLDAIEDRPYIKHPTAKRVHHLGV